MRLSSIAAALLLLAFTVPIKAQTSTGEVNGTISDPNGSGLPGAMVKLINQSTKIETEVKANESGYFTIVNVKPADIRTTAQAGDYLMYDDAQGYGFSMPGIEDGCIIAGSYGSIVIRPASSSARMSRSESSTTAP